MQAAVGVAQLDKLPEFIKKRQENWQHLYQGLQELEEFFILPEVPSKAEASPFGFVLTIRDGASFSRNEITTFLEERKTQNVSDEEQDEIEKSYGEPLEEIARTLILEE